jgi:hypothetical protein
LLHTAAGVNVLLKVGVGFTVTVTFCVLGQLLAVSVMAYTTLIGEDVVLTNVSLIEALLPLPAVLLIPVTTARDHENVVPVVAVVAV